MAFWNVENKSSDYNYHLGERPRETTTRIDDAAGVCGRSVDTGQTATPSAVVPAPLRNDDSLPSPGTPLRQRRLPASFWQEPNVPRRPGRSASWRATRRADPGRVTPQVGGGGGLLQQASPAERRPPPAVGSVGPTQYRSDLASFSAWRAAADPAAAAAAAAFIRDRKHALDFDVPAKPPAAASPADLVRQFGHLSPWAVVPGWPLPALSPGGHAGPAPEELAASAAVVAAYLRWRAAEDGFGPAVLAPASSAADWTAMAWRHCPTAATGAAPAVALQRFHRYHPY